MYLQYVHTYVILRVLYIHVDQICIMSPSLQERCVYRMSTISQKCTRNEVVPGRCWFNAKMQSQYTFRFRF